MLDSDIREMLDKLNLNENDTEYDEFVHYVTVDVLELLDEALGEKVMLDEQAYDIEKLIRVAILNRYQKENKENLLAAKKE